jgi:hypothetical protein
MIRDEDPPDRATSTNYRAPLMSITDSAGYARCGCRRICHWRNCHSKKGGRRSCAHAELIPISEHRPFEEEL